jgi:hypothetical protein
LDISFKKLNYLLNDRRNIKITNFIKRESINKPDGGVQCSTIHKHKQWTALMFINGALIKKKFDVQETKLKKDIEQNVYDPRVKMNVYSDNPALILANIMIKAKFGKNTNNFWDNVKVLADYCDTRI